MWTKEKEEMLLSLKVEKQQDLQPKRDAVEAYFREAGFLSGGMISSAAVIYHLLDNPEKIVELLQPLILPGE
jgi:hypothetical protein